MFTNIVPPGGLSGRGGSLSGALSYFPPGGGGGYPAWGGLRDVEHRRRGGGQAILCHARSDAYNCLPTGMVSFPNFFWGPVTTLPGGGVALIFPDISLMHSKKGIFFPALLIPVSFPHFVAVFLPSPTKTSQSHRGKNESVNPRGLTQAISWSDVGHWG